MRSVVAMYFYAFVFSFVLSLQAAEINTVIIPDTVNALPNYFFSLYCSLVQNREKPIKEQFLTMLNGNESDIFRWFCRIAAQDGGKDVCQVPTMFLGKKHEHALLPKRNDAKSVCDFDVMRQSFTNFAAEIGSDWKCLENSWSPNHKSYIRTKTDRVDDRLMKSIIDYFGLNTCAGVVIMPAYGYFPESILLDVTKGKEDCVLKMLGIVLQDKK